MKNAVLGSVSKRHWKRKELALDLRSQGMSYRDIMKKVEVSKSTVSLWCRHVPLTKKQQDELQNRRGDHMKGIRIAHTQFWRKRCEAFQEGVVKMNRWYTHPQFVAGVMLYWAEGNKKNGAGLANSDPDVIRFVVKWFGEFFGVTSDHFSIHMHLHSGQDEKVERAYWSKITGVPETNFLKTFVKKEGTGYRKNILYHGTVQLRVKEKGSTYKLFEILGSIAGFIKIVFNVEPQPEEWMDRSPHATGG